MTRRQSAAMFVNLPNGGRFWLRLVSMAVLVLGAGAAALPAFGQNTASVIATGNWNDTATWLTVPPGLFPNNGNPNPLDTWNVTANFGGTVTVNQDININNLDWSQGTIGGPNTLSLFGAASTWSTAGGKKLTNNWFSITRWTRHDICATA